MLESSQFNLDDLLQTINDEVQKFRYDHRIYSERVQLQTFNNTKQNSTCSKTNYLNTTETYDIISEDGRGAKELRLNPSSLKQKGLSLLSIVENSYVYDKSNNKNCNNSTRYKHHTSSKKSKHNRKIFQLFKKTCKEKTCHQNPKLKQHDCTVYVVSENCGLSSSEETFQTIVLPNDQRFQPNNCTQIPDTPSVTTSMEDIIHQILSNYSLSSTQNYQFSIIDRKNSSSSENPSITSAKFQLQRTCDNLPVKTPSTNNSRRKTIFSKFFLRQSKPNVKEPSSNMASFMAHDSVACPLCNNFHSTSSFKLEPSRTKTHVFKNRPNVNAFSKLISSKPNISSSSLLYNRPANLYCKEPSLFSSKNVNKTSSTSVCQKCIDLSSPKQVNKLKLCTCCQKMFSNLNSDPRQTKNSSHEFSPIPISRTSISQNSLNSTSLDSIFSKSIYGACSYSGLANSKFSSSTPVALGNEINRIHSEIFLVSVSQNFSPEQVDKSTSHTSQNVSSLLNNQKQMKKSSDLFFPKPVTRTCTTSTCKKLVNSTPSNLVSSTLTTQKEMQDSRLDSPKPVTKTGPRQADKSTSCKCQNILSNSPPSPKPTTKTCTNSTCPKLIDDKRSISSKSKQLKLNKKSSVLSTSTKSSLSLTNQEPLTVKVSSNSGYQKNSTDSITTKQNSVVKSSVLSTSTKSSLSLTNQEPLTVKASSNSGYQKNSTDSITTKQNSVVSKLPSDSKENLKNVSETKEGHIKRNNTKSQKNISEKKPIIRKSKNDNYEETTDEMNSQNTNKKLERITCKCGPDGRLSKADNKNFEKKIDKTTDSRIFEKTKKKMKCSCPQSKRREQLQDISEEKPDNNYESKPHKRPLSQTSQKEQFEDNSEKSYSKNFQENFDEEIEEMVSQKTNRSIASNNSEPKQTNKNLQENVDEEIDRMTFEKTSQNFASNSYEPIPHERLSNTTSLEEDISEKNHVQKIKKSINDETDTMISKETNKKFINNDCRPKQHERLLNTASQEELLNNKNICDKRRVKNSQKNTIEKTDKLISQEVNKSNSYEPKQDEILIDKTSQEATLNDISNKKPVTNSQKNSIEKTYNMISQEVNKSNDYEPKENEIRIDKTSQEDKLKDSISMSTYEKKIDEILAKLISQEETIKTVLKNACKNEDKVSSEEVKSLTKPVTLRNENIDKKDVKTSTKEDPDDGFKRIHSEQSNLNPSSLTKMKSGKKCFECDYLRDSVHTLMNIIYYIVSETRSNSLDEPMCRQFSDQISNDFCKTCKRKKHKHNNYVDEEAKRNSFIQNTKFKKREDYENMSNRIKCLDKVLQKTLLEPYLDYLLVEQLESPRNQRNSSELCLTSCSRNKNPLFHYLVKYLKRDQIFDDTITDYIKSLKKTSCSYDGYLFRRPYRL